MELTIATFENNENSLTPARRSFLLRREQAKERVIKRARENALRRQAGLRQLLHWDDPRHVIEDGDWTDDLRGLVNPDGSIHLWPYGEMTHVRRSAEYGLLDQYGCEGIHFYLWLGSPEPLGGSGLYGETREEVVIILDALGLMERAREGTVPVAEDSNDDYYPHRPPWTPPHPTPDPHPFFLEIREPHPHPPNSRVQWIVVTADTGSYVGTERNAEDALFDAAKRNLAARALGVETRYRVATRIGVKPYRPLVW